MQSADRTALPQEGELMVDLEALLDACDAHVATELSSMPEVKNVTSFDPIGEAPPIDARRWLRVEDVVAVVADLQSSTKLGLNKFAASTASIYEAALRPVVDIFSDFGAGWIPIHGDCVIGLFWDDSAVERAICAGITAKTFSRNSLVERLEKKWPEIPDTGFKVGLATSTVLVKRIGLARTPHQDLVWPGKAVNYAVKAAQSASAHQMIVTGSIWDAVANNDFLVFSCGCGGGPSDGIWSDHEIPALEHDEPERSGRMLSSQWCDKCGVAFCTAILGGETSRPDVNSLRHEAQLRLFKSAIAKKHAGDRERRRSLRALRSTQ
jgi:class 3 adenylate cyclase